MSIKVICPKILQPIKSEITSIFLRNLLIVGMAHEKYMLRLQIGGLSVNENKVQHI